MSRAIQLVWLKRDLRLSDHAPLANACAAGGPVLLLYIFEPELLADPHYDERHWRFVWQSLEAMQTALKPFGGHVQVLHGEPLAIFSALQPSTPFSATRKSGWPPRLLATADLPRSSPHQTYTGSKALAAPFSAAQHIGTAGTVGGRKSCAPHRPRRH